MKAKVWMIALVLVGGLGLTSCDKEDEMNDMQPAAAAPASNNNSGDQAVTNDDTPRPGGEAATAAK
jgi:hypothetical protein